MKLRTVAADECLCSPLNCLQTIFSAKNYLSTCCSACNLFYGILNTTIVIAFYLCLHWLICFDDDDDDDMRERIARFLRFLPRHESHNNRITDDEGRCDRNKCKHCFATVNVFVFTPLLPYWCVGGQRRWKRNISTINKSLWMPPNDNKISLQIACCKLHKMLEKSHNFPLWKIDCDREKLKLILLGMLWSSILSTNLVHFASDKMLKSSWVAIAMLSGKQ